MTDAGEPSVDQAVRSRRHTERLLVFVVALLGLLILGGLGAVLFKILALSSPPAAKSVRPAATVAVEQAADLAEAARVALPPGAVVKSVSLDGDRLAVHYEGAAGAGVAIVDVKTGAVLHRLELAPSSP